MSEICIILLTFNEERNIGACLDSLKSLQVPIFVVDSFSTDRTTQILTERHILFQQHAFENYAGQRNWAQQHCPFETEWVLHLDAGERLTPELINWLKTRFDPAGPIDGYLFSRRTWFMKRWIRYGGHYPNYHLRLFRRTKGYCENKAYDQHFLCTGRVESLPPGIDIIDHVADNLADFTEKHSRWARAEALERLAAKVRTGEVKAKIHGTPIERRRWLKTRIFDRSPLFLRAFGYFFYRYFFLLGFLDGAPGLVFHFLQGCWFRFLVDAMVLEYKQERSTD